MTYTVDIHRYDNTDPRLGRHVTHDSRNRQYAFVQDRLLGSAKPTTVSWTSNLPISDQGNVGACTGFSVLDILGYDGYWQALSVAERTYLEASMTLAGLLFYHTATVLDAFPGQYQPDDTGSDGPSAAKGGVKLGYFSGYQHTFTAKAFDAALQKGPVMVGTRWDEPMMTTDSAGFVNPDPSRVAGGHEYVIDGYSNSLDAYRIRNHWTADWGVNGFAWIDRDDFHELLKDQGDATIPTPLTTPAPTPTPVPPAPTPDPVDADVFSAYKSLQAWAKRKGV